MRLFLLYIACGFLPLSAYSKLQIEAEFIPYIRGFTAGYKVFSGDHLKVSHLRVYRDDLLLQGPERKTLKVGECQNGESEHPSIVIRRDRGWGGFSELGKEQLLSHELGHCLCHLDHQENTIMAEVMLPEAVYKLNRTKLLTHLYQSCKNELDYRKKVVEHNNRVDTHYRNLLNYLLEHGVEINFLDED